MTQIDQDSRCSAITKRGKPCRAGATEGGLCFFHANPKKAAELGRIGGKANSRLPIGTDPLPDLNTVKAVRDVVKRMITDVYAGKLHPRVAAGLAPLLHLQLRAIEKTDFEQRLAKTEQQLALLRAERDKAGQGKGDRKGNEEAPGKRPPQAVKAYGSDDGKIVEES